MEKFITSKKIAENMGIFHTEVLRVIDANLRNKSKFKGLYPPEIEQGSFTSKMGQTYRIYHLNKPAYIQLRSTFGKNAKAFSEAVVEALMLEQSNYVCRTSAILPEYISYVGAENEYMVKRESTSALDYLRKADVGHQLLDVDLGITLGFSKIMENIVLKEMENGITFEEHYKITIRESISKLNAFLKTI